MAFKITLITSPIPDGKVGDINVPDLATDENSLEDFEWQLIEMLEVWGLQLDELDIVSINEEV